MLSASLQSIGLDHPVTYAALAIAASLVIVWRTEALLDRGLEGTALGTLILPYCSGLGNLAFVFLLFGRQGDPAEVVVNALVNNVTNFTLLLGLPALFWPMQVITAGRARAGGRKGKGAGRNDEQRISRLSLLLTLAAVFFFSGAVWLLGADGRLDRSDGILLIALFLFWQSFQVIDVLKHSVRRKLRLGPLFIIDAVASLAAGVVLYLALEELVRALQAQPVKFLGPQSLGWITGWLLVVPNALVALVFASRGRADVVYSSQVGDGHICIPLCIGLAAALQPLSLPELFLPGVWILLAAAVLHAVVLLVRGGLERGPGALLVAAYGVFLYLGLAD